MNTDKKNIEIRKASQQDWPRVANILGDAFQNDPVMRWIIDEPTYYERFFAMELPGLFGKHEQVFINSEGTGATMWLPPGVVATEAESLSWSLLGVFLRILFTRGMAPVKRLQHVEAMFKKHHPLEPHFYLHAIGARLAHQGEGIGSAFMRHGTDVCDANAAAAYLESSNERNVPLYINHGFKVVAEESLPDGGPPIWFMWREART